jgi:hypothetical protein
LADKMVVIAAVSVVLPWSTWPIVPTFTCGLVRSNLLFAISILRIKSNASDRFKVSSEASIRLPLAAGGAPKKTDQ